MREPEKGSCFTLYLPVQASPSHFPVTYILVETDWRDIAGAVAFLLQFGSATPQIKAAAGCPPVDQGHGARQRGDGQLGKLAPRPLVEWVS